MRVFRFHAGLLDAIVGASAVSSRLSCEELEHSAVEDDPLVSAPAIHRTVPAHECTLPVGLGPRSIFDAGDTMPPCKGFSPGAEPIAWPCRLIEVSDGVLRRIVLRHYETAEWIESQVRRRSLQSPPRHGNYKQRVSRTLAKLIGEELHVAPAASPAFTSSTPALDPPKQTSR